MSTHHIRQRRLPQPADHQYTLAELRQFREDLSEIQRVARRKRLLGEPDVLLELAADSLSERLARMLREARQ